MPHKLYVAKNRHLILQCSHAIMEKNQTAHLFTHYTRKTMNQQRAPLKAFLLDHKDWLEKVGGDLIRRKGRTVDEYILDFIKPGFKFDELALLAFVRMHHKHIFVLMDGRYWTSRKDNDVTRCDLKFGYVGNLLFVPLLHESAVHRRFKDGTRCVNMFLRPRLERRSKGYDVPSHFSTECSELMFPDRFCTDISDTFLRADLPCDVGIEYKFVDNTSFTPQRVLPENEENVCYSSQINDVNTDVDVKVCLSEASCSDESRNPIGTAHVILPEHTTDSTDDIPLSSHEKATDEPLCLEVSKQTDAEHQFGTDEPLCTHVGNESEENIEFSEHSGNVSPLPQAVSQVGDSFESPGSASPVTDQEVNIAVENSATVSDEKQSDSVHDNVTDQEVNIAVENSATVSDEKQSDSVYDNVTDQEVNIAVENSATVSDEKQSDSVYDNVTDQEVNIAVENSATVSDEKQSDSVYDNVTDQEVNIAVENSATVSDEKQSDSVYDNVTDQEVNIAVENSATVSDEKQSDSVYDNVTDQEVKIAVEKSATISDEKQLDLLPESVLNDVEASESNHTESSEGTGNSANPLIPQNEEASIVQKTNLDSNVNTENELDGTAQIPPILPNILPNMEETEASKSTETEDKIEKNSDDGNLAAYEADTDIETPLGTESPKPKADINPSSTAGETDSDSGVDIDKRDEDSCSCSGSCTCSSSSSISSSSDASSIEGSATNGEPKNTGKRGKRKYSDASDQANHSEHESRPVKRKLRQYLKKKPDYAVDSSSSEEGEGSQYSESNESEDEFVTVQTKTKKVVKKILKTKS